MSPTGPHFSTINFSNKNKQQKHVQALTVDPLETSDHQFDDSP